MNKEFVPEYTIADGYNPNAKMHLISFTLKSILIIIKMNLKLFDPFLQKKIN
jgi:hypothetical protein